VYTPPHFREERVAVLHALLREYPLATLVTRGPDGLCADHIPMEVEPGGPDGLGVLRGHVARANPVWREAAGGDALAVFQGPSGYVTPSWYPAKAAHGQVVPTWNYAVVHAHGPLRAIDDREWLRAFVTRLTERHEGGRAAPWHVTDAPADYVERMLGGIVGLELTVRRLEGKWKVSQNRDAADRAGVVAGLRAAGDAASLAMAEAVERAGGGRP
jgi:transcriptional regulator